MFDIVTEKLVNTKERSAGYDVSFEGLFSSASSPIDSGASIIDIRSQGVLLGSNYIAVNNTSGNGQKIQMDSSTFEKYFEVYTNNNLHCMKLITADVMDNILKFRKETDIPLDIVII